MESGRRDFGVLGVHARTIVGDRELIAPTALPHCSGVNQSTKFPCPRTALVTPTPTRRIHPPCEAEVRSSVRSQMERLCENSRRCQKTPENDHQNTLAENQKALYAILERPNSREQSFHTVSLIWHMFLFYGVWRSRGRRRHCNCLPIR